MDFCRHVNPFRFCTGLRVIGYFMILLVGAIVVLSYYAVVIVAWGPHLIRGGVSSSSVLAFAIVAVFHVLLVLLIWSYFMVAFRDPGSVPENWRPILDEASVEAGSSVALSDQLPPAIMASSWPPADGVDRRPAIRYCNRCQNSKPPRCHHCSICQRCVLKMDHHCVWVVNCVGACNYKFFLLFLVTNCSLPSYAFVIYCKNFRSWTIIIASVLIYIYICIHTHISSSSCLLFFVKFYTFLETVLDTFALLPRFIKFFGAARHSGPPGSLAIAFLAFVLNIAFALSLLCFLVMHVSLLLSNTTTIEVYEKKKAVRWKYDMGKRKNFEQVFGTKKLLWILPIISKEDLENIPALRGLDFPTQPDGEG